MARRILNADLGKWTEAELRAALEVEVAALNRRRRLGTISDRQVGDLLYREARCVAIGNAIRAKNASR